ncbi:hypothetical protein L1887_16298 [Cichorium endivia]|nr:hypothetical protein L1887_16298 [Cichorium endivia]
MTNSRGGYEAHGESGKMWEKSHEQQGLMDDDVAEVVANSDSLECFKELISCRNGAKNIIYQYSVVGSDIACSFSKAYTVTLTLKIEDRYNIKLISSSNHERSSSIRLHRPFISSLSIRVHSRIRSFN